MPFPGLAKKIKPHLREYLSYANQPVLGSYLQLHSYLSHTYQANTFTALKQPEGQASGNEWPTRYPRAFCYHLNKPVPHYLCRLVLPCLNLLLLLALLPPDGCWCLPSMTHHDPFPGTWECNKLLPPKSHSHFLPLMHQLYPIILNIHILKTNITSHICPWKSSASVMPVYDPHKQVSDYH